MEAVIFAAFAGAMVALGLDYLIERSKSRSAGELIAAVIHFSAAGIAIALAVQA